MEDLKIPHEGAIRARCDNQSEIETTNNPMQHERISMLTDTSSRRKVTLRLSFQSTRCQPRYIHERLLRKQFR